MTFRQALAYAVARSEIMADAVEKVQAAEGTGKAIHCYIFSIGDEAFFYGYDGVEVQKGKYRPGRAQYLINKGETLVIE